MKAIRPYILGIALVAISAILTIIADQTSWFADWYNQAIYQLFVTNTGRLMGAIPLPVFELLLYFLIILIIIWLTRLIIFMIGYIRKKDLRRGNGTHIRKHIKCGIIRLWNIVCILIFLFVIHCGINYQRTSFASIYGFGRDSYTIDELTTVAMRLADEVNSRSMQVERDSNGVMVFYTSNSQPVIDAMHRLSERYPSLHGYYPSPKAVLFPFILSVQQVSGIFVPFTIEAYFNGAMVGYTIPFTMAHELAHVRGFMSEDEANFIAFLACIHSDQVELQYSGYLMGFVYVINELNRYDRSQAQYIMSMLREYVRMDLAANREFWARYDGPIAEMQDRVNDVFLQAQGVEGGILSYNKVVDLILSYYMR